MKCVRASIRSLIKCKHATTGMRSSNPLSKQDLPVPPLSHLDFIHKLRVWFPKSRLVKWLMTKMLNFSSREWKNTIYNILTGYGCYRPPAEITVPAKHYFNPYVKNMVTHVPPFLKNKAVEYDDGVPASVPQMAYDLTEFLVFLKHGRRPDLKVEALS
eukprot:TRINITY_DN4013_c0_g1_i3.p1 TRINITY_DN4013_c0_g1~~TRINITY_DN4013_c0_g1_i3.p1  ORF type:complete len:158 (-),score=27.43 TRINITY_DN4013_c0_g1_i3:340-813(-)